MNAILPLVALLLMSSLWRLLSSESKFLWQIRLLYGSTYLLMITSALLSLSIVVADTFAPEFLVRSWYASITAVFVSLCVIACPNLERFRAPLLLALAGACAALMLTDTIISGARVLPTSIGFQESMATKISGDHYEKWLLLIRAMAAVQVASLLFRALRWKSQSRDSNAAALLLASLIPTYLAMIVLSNQMMQEVPSFNAQPIVPLCCVVFAFFVVHVQKGSAMLAFHPGATAVDSARIRDVLKLLERDDVSNVALVAQLKGLGLASGPLYVVRQGQAMNLGNLADHAWSLGLSEQLRGVVARFPLALPSSLN